MMSGARALFGDWVITGRGKTERDLNMNISKLKKGG